MHFPLHFVFKVMALAPQFSVLDAQGLEVCYVRQKMFKLREHISVFEDARQQSLLAEIHADRMIDFSASYTFVDVSQQVLGSVKRKGLRSLWRTAYEIYIADAQVYTIREGNPWTKVLDSLVGELPIIGALTGYILHPHYDVMDSQGQTCYTLFKRPSFFGRRFELVERTPRPDDLVVVMSLMMMILLERRRG